MEPKFTKITNKHEITWLWGDGGWGLKVLIMCWESAKKALRRGWEGYDRAQESVEKSMGKVSWESVEKVSRNCKEIVDKL